MTIIRIGHGYDVHALVSDRKLILGGVEIPHEKGLLGHSDADVLLHAIMDSILGGLGLGDIGKHFPDTDDAFKNISSMVLLERVTILLDEQGYCVGNLDATIMAQKPKLLPYIPQMVANISKTLNCSLSQINVKATTTEKLGFVGREEGMASEAVVLLIKK